MKSKNKVRYVSSDAHKVDKEFQSYFGVSFQPFFLGFIIPNDNSILIDLVKFEDFLTKEYSYQGSMSDFILEKHGKKAHNFLLKLI